MAKNYNPADAFRKAQRAKELKKNKELRKKTRDVQTVKRDTRDLESDIRSLRGKTDNASKSRIAELEAELAYIMKTKEAYVKEHPEAKDKVFKPRGAGGGGQRQEDEGEGSGGGEWKGKEGLYDETTGRLRDPTRSAYYDPVYNPWGAPPPGMPYKEREGLEDEGDSEDGSEEESDEEIMMPDGPPPAEGSEDGESEDEDDIPLPSGPPPPKAVPPPPPAGPSGWGGRRAPVPVPFHQPPIHPPGPSMGMGAQYPPYPPPQQFAPPPPSVAEPMRQGRHQNPRGIRQIQDPLDDEPTQTYQGYHASLPARPPPSAPGLPGLPAGLPGSTPAPTRPPPSSAPTAAPAEITAAPQLRDLRKEATIFVPRNLKRKAPSGVSGAAVGGRINAAPGGGVVDADGDERVVRKVESGLMGKLKGVLGPDMGSGGGGDGAGGKGGGAKAQGAKERADEDYERFLAGLGDIS